MLEPKNLITEKELLQFVVELARVHGFLVYHQIDTGRCVKCGNPNFSKRIGPGFPDLVIAGHGRVLIVELKSEKGPTRPEQKEWGEVLRKGPAEYYFWRPSDMDTLTQILATNSGGLG